MVACMLTFITLSYLYKLRNRDDSDDIFNYYIAAENFYKMISIEEISTIIIMSDTLILVIGPLYKNTLLLLNTF